MANNEPSVRYYVPRFDERNIQCRPTGAQMAAAARYFNTATNHRLLDKLKFYIRHECILDFVTICYAM